MTTVLKLGGSVVTQKDEPETVDRSRLDALAAALSDVDGRLVVVHGGGSFGHHHAANHGVSVADGTTDPAAVRAIHGAMLRLNEAVVTALVDHGVPGLPVQPLSMAARDGTGTLALSTAAVERQLSEGFVPVLHGDVVVHEGKGATIVSGDELVARLASTLDADRVGVCTTVPGVLDASGDVVDRIDAMAEVRDLLGDSESTDVTGGMAGKVQSLLALDVPAAVFGPDAIEAFVRGESPGTIVDGRDSER